jgi:antitoxin HicB
MKNKHIGTSFDSFLVEEGLLAQASTVATKRVITYQIKQEMKKRNLAKSELAKQMKTSRAALERLLDPNNESVTLHTLEKAAVALGKKLEVKLI